METKLINVQGKGPVTKAKSGRFEVSLWHWKKIIPQPENVRDLFPEREVDMYRACVRHSKWNRGTQSWEDTVIWCEIEELRSLGEALDNLNGGEE